MGLDTPNLNQSGTMDVTYQNQQYTGMLMARNAPNGSWQAGTSYNTSNIEGPVFIATTDGKYVEFAEGETFRVNNIRAKDGSDISNVSTTKYAYQTSNVSELQEMQSRLTALKEEIEEREPTGGGGGFGGFGGSQSIAVVAAVAAAAFLLTRD
jgi:hypothetical protein